MDNPRSLRTKIPTTLFYQGKKKPRRLPLQQTAITNCDNQTTHLFPFDHLLFYVKSSTDFQEKFERKHPSQLKHDFAWFAYKKANWNKISQFVTDLFWPLPQKQNRSYSTHLYEIPQGFLTIKNKHFVTLAHWVGKESSHILKEIDTSQKSNRMKGKPDLKAKMGENQT